MTSDRWDALHLRHSSTPTIHALLGFLDNPEMVAALTALASDGPRLFPGEPESDEGQVRRTADRGQYRQTAGAAAASCNAGVVVLSSFPPV